MTTRTIITGEIVGGTGIRPAHGTTWADLTTWADYDNWYSTSGTQVEIRLDDDLGSVKTVIPTLNLVVEGALTLSLKISDTGSFSGEETTVSLVEETAVGFVPGRYFRWSITVDADSTYAVPAIRVYQTNYNSVAYVEELHNDLNIYGNEDSENINDITTNLGYVLNIQATANQGGLYVVDGYIQSAADHTTRTAAPFTVNDVSLTATDFANNKFSGFPVLDFTDDFPNLSNLEFDTLTCWQTLSSSSDWTLETWVRLNTIGTSQTVVGQFDVDDTRSAAADAWSLTFSHGGSGTLQFTGGTDAAGLVTLQASGVIAATTWHHIAVVRSGSTIYLYVDGSQQDSTTYYDIDVQSSSVFIGAFDSTGADTPAALDFDAYMTNFRISDTARYSGSSYTVPTGPFSNDANTQLLIGSRLVDENGFEDNGDGYIIQQKGGSAQIENKNPPRVRVVDYAGNPWDGSADIVLRGYPKIELRNNRVSAVA